MGDAPKKTPGVLRKELAAKERTKQKKEAKKDMDDKVSRAEVERASPWHQRILS